MPTALTLDRLRRYAIARSLFEPTTLPRAIAKLGFVQLDPIRAPARAQDLTLRHRVEGYRAGELGQVIGWANAAVRGGRLQLQPGYVSGRAPSDAAFGPALQEEEASLERFLGL